MTVLPRLSLIHCAVGSSSGSPARNKYLSFDRSYFASHSGSCFFNTRIAVGEENMVRTPYFSQIRHQMPGSGAVGRPSYMIAVAPAINGPYTL